MCRRHPSGHISRGTARIAARSQSGGNWSRRIASSTARLEASRHRSVFAGGERRPPRAGVPTGGRRGRRKYSSAVSGVPAASSSGIGRRGPRRSEGTAASSAVINRPSAARRDACAAGVTTRARAFDSGFISSSASASASASSSGARLDAARRAAASAASGPSSASYPGPQPRKYRGADEDEASRDDSPRASDASGAGEADATAARASARHHRARPRIARDATCEARRTRTSRDAPRDERAPCVLDDADFSARHDYRI